MKENEMELPYDKTKVHELIQFAFDEFNLSIKNIEKDILSDNALTSMDATYTCLSWLIHLHAYVIEESYDMEALFKKFKEQEKSLFGELNGH